MASHDIWLLTCARIPTAHGEFDLCLYGDGRDGEEHLAMLMGDVHGQEDVLVRVHSECFTGDVMGSKRCDCGDQLDQAMGLIARAGRGILLYLRQEGRGIGLHDKLRAYNLQDEGFDTVDANLMLGHEPDERDYGIAAEILGQLDVRSIRLLTNNPRKLEELDNLGVKVNARVPLQAEITRENASYMHTKHVRLNHLLSFEPQDGASSRHALQDDDGRA